MNNTKTLSGILNIVAATSLSVLSTFTTIAAKEITEPEHQNDNTPTSTIQEPEPVKSFMSESTRETYGTYIDFITNYTPNLTILTFYYNN